MSQWVSIEYAVSMVSMVSMVSRVSMVSAVSVVSVQVLSSQRESLKDGRDSHGEMDGKRKER